MRCGYHQAGACSSCTLLGVPYSQQVAGKLARARELLGPFAGQDQDPDRAWLDPVTSAPEGFRNKVKMVVAGSWRHPTLGILDHAGAGVDLRGCGLADPRITAALGPVAGLIRRARIEPYDVPARRGELKNVLITVSPGGELMVRFVLRSTRRVEAIRAHLPRLLAQVPAIAVASVNILPEHKAVLEGEREFPLTARTTLDMDLPGLPLVLGPKSFFQTNTAVAGAMYAQARAWCDQVTAAAGPAGGPDEPGPGAPGCGEPPSGQPAPGSSPGTGPRPRDGRGPHVWDLYCGVGGFALACAAPGRAVTGVEVSAEAVAAARRSARRAGAAVRFIAADATAWAQEQPGAPGLVVVNPPRRGLGPGLSTWLQDSRVPAVIYSSCNAESLARDLAAMPSLRIAQARLFDMFPQTAHFETMVLLARA